MKILLKILKYLGIVILAILIVALLVRFLIQRISYTGSQKNYEISERQKVKLEGHEQKYLIESKSTKNPILITTGSSFLSPTLFGIGYRDYHQKLTEKFLLVQYDQYGNGLNYSTESISFDYYTTSLIDLVNVLHKLYPENKIYILGMNENTVFVMQAALKLNSIISGIISFNPFISYQESKTNINSYLTNLKLSSNDISKLNNAMDGKTLDDYKTVYNLGNRYINNFGGKNFDTNYFYKSVLHLLLSSDYTLKDCYRIFNSEDNDIYIKLVNNFYELNMTETLNKISIPHLIINGKYNYLTSINTLKKIENDKTTIKELYGTGEIISDQDKNDFFDYIINFN